MNERFQNAGHKSVTSTLNITFFETHGLCICYVFFMYGHLGSTTQLNTSSSVLNS